jgi:hypothetical protein
VAASPFWPRRKSSWPFRTSAGPKVLPVLRHLSIFSLRGTAPGKGGPPTVSASPVAVAGHRGGCGRAAGRGVLCVGGRTMRGGGAGRQRRCHRRSRAAHVTGPSRTPLRQQRCHHVQDPATVTVPIGIWQAPLNGARAVQHRVHGPAAATAPAPAPQRGRGGRGRRPAPAAPESQPRTALIRHPRPRTLPSPRRLR